MSARELLEAKIARLLVEGRLQAHEVRPGLVRATCQGDSGRLYHLGLWRGSWGCSCPAGQFSRADCAHLAALKRVVAVPELQPAGLTAERLLEAQREATAVRNGRRSA